MFDAPEGDAWVGGDHLVDEHHAGLKLVDEPFAFAFVGGPGAGAEAETAIVVEADGFRTNEPFGGNAGLAVVDDACLHGGGDGGVEIGTGHYDKGVASAELEHNFLNAFGGCDAYLDAGLLASCESCGDYARVVE